MGATANVYKAKDLKEENKIVAIKQIITSKLSKKQLEDIIVYFYYYFFLN